MSSIPVIMRPLPEIASISGIPETTLCEFVRRRLIHYRGGPADWGVPSDHPANDPRGAKLSLEMAVFVNHIYLDCFRNGGGWDELRHRIDNCDCDSEADAHRVALDALNRYCAQEELIDRLHLAARFHAQRAAETSIT